MGVVSVEFNDISNNVFFFTFSPFAGVTLGDSTVTSISPPAGSVTSSPVLSTPQMGSDRDFPSVCGVYRKKIRVFDLIERLP